MAMDSVLAARRPFVGVWTLESFTEKTDSSAELNPLGPAPLGFLIYTAEGVVSAQLMKRDRMALGTDPWELDESNGGTDLKKGYIAYCGLYEVDEENSEVIHTPIVALLPNLLGRKQHRHFAFDDQMLTLATVRKRSDGDMAESRLVWTRLPQIANVSANGDSVWSSY